MDPNVLVRKHLKKHDAKTMNANSLAAHNLENEILVGRKQRIIRREAEWADAELCFRIDQNAIILKSLNWISANRTANS